MKYELLPLKYGYGALEPVIDEETMLIHHTKHHQGYITKLNDVLEKHAEEANRPLEDLLENLDSLSWSEADKTALRNNGGGHLNHSLFWKIMNPAAAKDENLVKEIESVFGPLEEFRKKFGEEAGARFGSGWAWLARSEKGELKIYSLPNQDSPYLKGHTPVLGLDVWEHAYYLKYQNRRPEYIENWWKTVKLID